MTEREEAIWRMDPSVESVLAPSSHTGWVPGDGPISVRPNQRVSIDYTLLTAGGDAHHAFGVVPLLDGKPLEWRKLAAVPPSSRINASVRGDFEVTMPEEPGIHVLRLGTWRNPFLRRFDEPGDEIDIEQRHVSGEGSTPVRFRVVKDDRE